MKSEITTKIGWRAPSNIALVKYWGKKAGQLPENGSLSITLDHSSTTTYLTFHRKKQEDREITMEYSFHGKKHPKFSEKVAGYLNRLHSELPFLTDYHLIIQSGNNFPHSAGIASSASSMAALALCLVSMEELVTNKKWETDDFFRRASSLARLGSGSASRSVYGGLVSWGKIDSVNESSEEYASPFPLSGDSRFRHLRDSILIVNSAEKPFSSSSGHASMTDHPYREGRRAQANSNIHIMMEAIRGDDFQALAKISENEALSLHALLLSSSTGVILLNPNTLRIIEEIRNFRAQTNLELFFTIDAGPNVHLVYFEDQRDNILPFIRERLSKYCEKDKWIDDRIGNGPEQLTIQTEN
jgi:diphosphomevalonate decarboxylase